MPLRTQPRITMTENTAAIGAAAQSEINVNRFKQHVDKIFLSAAKTGKEPALDTRRSLPEMT